MRCLILIMLCMLVCLPNARAGQADAKLIKVVALSRHGLRAPTQDAKLLEMWSQKPWPVWPVERGDLTPRGGRLVTAMWCNLRKSLEKAGLFSSEVCLPQNAVYVRPDVDERTRATASAILEGLAPGCKLGFAVAKGKVDPLFHPVKAGLYRFDAIPVAMSVLNRAHGGLERLQEEFAGQLELMGKIVGPPAASLCSRFALMPKCELADLPNAISVFSDGTGVRIMGSLGVASSLAEIFLLEYGEWPGVSAGWGEVNGQILAQLLPIHSRIFDVVNRAQMIAWAKGSSLLTEMTDALFGRHYDKAVNEAKLAIYVGHDTNIANIGALMGFDWQAKGYPPNGIPPAGVLLLELWQKNGRQEVVARFASQPPEVLHKAFGDYPLSDYAPKIVPAHGQDGVVALEAGEFRKLVEQATVGAPLAPAQKTELEYGPVLPEQSQTTH